MQGSKVQCPLIPRKGNRKDATRKQVIRVRGNRDSKRGKRMHVCVWCVGGTQHTQKNGERRSFVCVIGFRPMVFEPAPSG